MKQKCTATRIVDGKDCSSPAKYEVRFGNHPMGYVCGIHARAYTPKALFPLTEAKLKS